MEAKKNPNKDVHGQSGKFFLIGLTLSVALAIMAFEWRSEKVFYPEREFDKTHAEATFQLQSHTIAPEKIVEPKKKPAPLQKSINLTTETTNETTQAEENPIVEFESEVYIGFDSIALDPEPQETIHLFPEVKPEPDGGFEGFYKFVGKNLKYPKQAQRVHAEGKVYVEFVVDKNGQVTNMKVIKGIGSGCDEEAMRVLALTKWQPGRQRGKPVKVRMTMPLNFVLN